MKMKFNFKIGAGLGLALILGACRPAPPAAPPVADGSDVQRLVALLDYIAGDYGGAVQGGRITDAGEYEEQQRFVHDVVALTHGLIADGGNAPDPVRRSVDRMAELVSGQADPAIVGAACHAAKAAVIERFGVRTAPARRPSRDQARVLYAESCAICHGPRGDADTERARALNPSPVNFHDPEIRSKLSPYRVFNTLTFGVSGTSMASFESLSPEERWSLAFYVLSLAHQDDPEGEGVKAAMPLTEMASLTDEEVVAALREQGHSSPARGLRFLRTVAPFEPPEVAAGVAETRLRVRRALAAYSAGKAHDADRLVLDAYLLGFEPLEPHLRTRDPQGTTDLEKAFHTLRTSIGRGESPGAVQEQALALERRLSALAEPRQNVFPFAAAALIYLREGIEAALLIGALLAAVRRLGQPEAARYVHWGWMAALPAGVLTWWILDRLLEVGPAERELVEAGTALLAAAVLFWVSFWLISKAESQRWMDYLKRTVAASLTRRNRLALLSMAFLAVYREAAETVLFTQALILDAPDQRSHIWLGALFGMGLTVLVAVFMRRAVLSLPIGPFFAVSGILLCLLAVSFAGAGLYDLVSAGYVPPRPVRFAEVPWMGVHPDLNGLVVQAAIVLTVLGTGIAGLKRR
jgi:high-affinity iron transporter